jgi:dsDNA-specific endonuclease/ATPase MutS2
MRSLQKIEVFTKIPNNDNKKSQKSRKISKLNSKKLQNSRKFSTKLRKIIQNLTKNKKSQINILDNIEIKIKHKRKIIWIPTLYHHLTPQLKLLRLVGLGKNKKNSPPKQKWMQQDWQNLRTNCKILQ